LNDDLVLDFQACFDHEHMYIRIENKSHNAQSGFALAINQNALGLSMSAQPEWPATLLPGDSSEVVAPITFSRANVGNQSKGSLEVALRTGSTTLFGLGSLPILQALVPEGRLSEPQWRELVSSNVEGL
jgi:hypothetical protein